MPWAKSRNASANEAIFGTVDRNSDHQEHEAQDHAEARSAHRLVGEVVETQRAIEAVDDRHAVQHHSRGDGAQQEVLHGGLGSDAGFAIEGDHGIQRQRHELDADVHREQAVGRHHDEHAEQRGQRQHVVLAAHHAATFEIVARIQQRDRDAREAE
jgi:hypothetical protein